MPMIELVAGVGSCHVLVVLVKLMMVVGIVKIQKRVTVTLALITVVGEQVGQIFHSLRHQHHLSHVCVQKPDGAHYWDHFPVPEEVRFGLGRDQEVHEIQSQALV